MAVEDSVAQDQLRAFIERIERMNEEAKAIKDDTKEIYAEAKGNGFDTKIIRKLVTIRKQDANERMEQEGLLDLYMSALGMVGVSGAHIDDRRNSIADEIDDALLETVAETAKTPEGRKALLDAVEAHKNVKKVSQLRADPALAIVEPAIIESKLQKVQTAQTEPQPAPQAGSDLTAPPSPQGQVAPNSETDTPVSNEAPMAVYGDGVEVATAPLSESVDILPGGVQLSKDGRVDASPAVVNSEPDATPAGSVVDNESGVTGGESAAPLYAAPGVITWESTPPEGVERHPYSAAFGDLGQYIHVIADDIAGAKAAPIQKIGNVILDGWARYMTARGAFGLDGRPTEYQVVQYDGSDPLLDCIRWNIAGRMLSDKDKQKVVARLIAIEPKRKAEIIKAVAEMAI